MDDMGDWVVVFWPLRSIEKGMIWRIVDQVTGCMTKICRFMIY